MTLSNTLVCLTGGIATGKTRVGEWFAAKDWVVICTDQIVHQLYLPGEALTAQIAQEFGNDFLKEGGIDRLKLGELVFHDESARQRLNALVHPRVREIWKSQAAEAIYNGRKTMVIIPLAFEVNAISEFQETWVVACSKIEQENRMRQRGLSETQIAERLQSQWPLQKKIDLADRVIWNNESWTLTEEQLEEMLASGVHRF